MLESRDIGPDQVRLSFHPPSCSGPELDTDVEQDTALCDAIPLQSLTTAFPYSTRHHNILDQSSNAGGHHYQRPPATSRQAHNATDHYKSEGNRLNTFRDWRYHRVVRGEHLASNGFFYTGTADKVRCAFCNVALHSWSPGDVVEVEHRRAAPDCPFVMGREVGNIPLPPSQHPPAQHHQVAPQPFPQHASSSQQQASGGASACGSLAGYSSFPASSSSSSQINTAMAFEGQRLASFECWPRQLNQKPEELARCGLYYSGDGDRVTCFSCQVILHDWELNDDPYKEHVRWSPDCQFLRDLEGENSGERQSKGGNCGEALQGQGQTEEEMMESPAVEALLFSGLDRETIRRALTALRKKNVVGQAVTAEVLMTAVMELEEGVSDPVRQSSSGNVSEAEYQQLQQENESLRERQQCKVCMENDVEVIFYPCKHLVCCQACGDEVMDCPICRVPVQRRDKIFMA